MNTLKNQIKQAVWGKELTLNRKIFNILAMAGFAISLFMTCASFFSNSSVGEAVVNFTSALFSLGMLLLHVKTKNYHLCSVITISVIFLVAFPALFFSSDGYKGGMPSFFVFAVIFTIFLVRGKIMLVLVALQYIVFIAISFYAYYYPNSIIFYRNEFDLLLDIIFGFVSVSLVLGVTMFLQFRMYLIQQKQLEQARLDAERANRAKSAFLANMNHEIRTPIGIILGTNEIISRDAHSKQIKEQVAKIKSAGELLDALINNVLDFVKIEAEKTVLNPQTYLLSGLLNEIEQYSRILCKKKELEFTLAVEHNVSDYLIGDALAIKQVLLNIINNAVKYTEKGSVTLHVKQIQAENNEELKLNFIISDTGIGIKQEEVDEIFDAFKRIDRNNGRYVEGVGLGLSIVKQLLTLMKGDIEVVSIFGKGSDFKIYIPQKIAPDAPKMQIEDTQSTFIAPAVKLLVVDDNNENLLLIKALLERTAMQIDTAQNAQQCYDFMSKKKYDVLLMDYMMPDMNGVELVSELNKKYKLNVPVIALTANADSNTKTYLLQNGFSHYLTKPVTWQLMEQAILQYIPKEKYKIVELSREDSRDERFEEIVKLSDKLEECGIDCDMAFHYSANNYELFYKSIIIYLSHVDDEIISAEKLLENREFESLYFVVHSLKSRAKNIGANKLYTTAAELEPLCNLKKQEELCARMPYLFYLWKKSKTGLLIIKESVKGDFVV